MSDTAASGTACPGRLQTARLLLRRETMLASLALARPASLRNRALAGVQAALTLAIALPAVHVSAFPELIGFAALGALVALFGRFAPRRKRGRVVLLCGLCQTGAVCLMSLTGLLGLPPAAQLVLLAVLCGLFHHLTVARDFGPPGALIFVFAAGAGLAPLPDMAALAERGAATGLVSLLAWAVCAVTERFRETPPVGQVPAPRGPGLTASARVTVGTGLALAIGAASGAQHPVWAAMGALAVMQGPLLHINLHRALQRMAGTMVGAVIAWALLMQEPSLWTILAALIALQIATEAVIGSNYGLGQIFVTPMALLMSHLAAPASAGAAMAPERVLDTMLGAAVGMAVAVLLSTLDDRHRLAAHSAR